MNIKEEKRIDLELRAPYDFKAAMELALMQATESPDPSTQNGAVLIGKDSSWVYGSCNKFPRGVSYTDDRWVRPPEGPKYMFIEHAERNVIFRAAQYGVATAGATMVCPWAACADCARAIVQAGIMTLIRFPMPAKNTHARWDDSCAVGDTIMTEAGVTIFEHEFVGIEIPELRRDGKIWDPYAAAPSVNWAATPDPVKV